MQGNYSLELIFGETKCYLNFWDSINGNDVCCEIRDGKIFIDSEDDDAETQKEISFSEFIELVQNSINLQ